MGEILWLEYFKLTPDKQLCTFSWIMSTLKIPIHISVQKFVIHGRKEGNRIFIAKIQRVRDY